ncbi:MAG: Crp/Fnr family transcriptional regulator [Kordiimonadaceae bacterium]|nr:Crp/Fnr family transcriptional regulator [Kordiimonadaceae bacterium]
MIDWQKMSDITGGGWIHNLSQHVRAAVRDVMQLKSVENKQAIFRQGEDSTILYEIVTGQVLITHLSIDGEESLVTIFGPNDCVGEQGLIDGLPRSNSASAYGDCTLRTLTKPTFQTLRQQFPEITENLLQLVSRRFRMSLQLGAEVSSFPLRTRILRRLYLLAKAHGESVDGTIKINFKLSQTDMGKWVGYSRQSVNTEIQNIENDGLIQSTTNGLIITDIEATQEELGEDELIPYHEPDAVD